MKFPSAGSFFGKRSTQAVIEQSLSMMRTDFQLLLQVRLNAKVSFYATAFNLIFLKTSYFVINRKKVLMMLRRNDSV